MIIRQALFEGKILPSRSPDFRAYVETNLLPMRRSFPHAREVRVMYEVDRDAGTSPGLCWSCQSLLTMRRRCRGRSTLLSGTKAER